LKDGFEANVTVPELPGRVFKGRIARNAGSLQPGTRTLLTEVDVDNPDGELRAGIYCRVHFQIPRREPIIIIPSQALIFNASGLSAAVYEDGTVRLRRLDLLRDDGAQVEVRRGLNPGDRVILSPPVNVRDGMRVELAEEPPAKTALSDPEAPRGLIQRLWHPKHIENRRADHRLNGQSQP
jgi:multidrug efflux pump subunit AcrA (membrane-fusion protein)